MGLRQHGKAEQVLRRALDIDPEHARLRCLLGDVLVTLEKLDQAIREYRLVDGYSTTYAYAQDGLGRALKKQGHNACLPGRPAELRGRATRTASSRATTPPT
jgi:predicted Zn-dependent protease